MRSAMESGHELGPVKSAAAMEHNDADFQKSAASRDSARLAALGKRQTLKRNFAFMSMLGFSCTLMGTWEGVLVTFLIGFSNGGPAGLLYGFLFVWLGTLSVFLTMGELASMAPTAGGQFVWVYMLAPKSSRNFWSYVTGWITCAAWQASLTTAAFFSATLIQGLLVQNVPTYNFETWHGTLLLWAVVLLALFINTVVSAALPKLEGLILILHIVGFFAIIIPLVYLAPTKSDSPSVWTVFLNEGGWSTQGLSWFIGLSGSAVAFLGADGAIHMSEEIQNASINVPRSMISSIFINGVLAFGMLVAVLYCMGDPTAAAGSPTGYPFIEIFYQATNSLGGTTVMTSIVLLLAFSASIATLASSSRMIWSFARDRGLPGHTYLSMVNSRTSVPVLAIIVTMTIACLLSLINIGSPTAFNDVVSLTVETLYASYLLCLTLLLWRRCRGEIHSADYEKPIISDEATDEVHLSWGPWRLPGWFGTANNAVAVAFLLIMMFFNFWPTTNPTTAATMNYSIVVLGAVLIFSVLYYIGWARRSYSGPVREVTL